MIGQIELWEELVFDRIEDVGTKTDTFRNFRGNSFAVCPLIAGNVERAIERIVRFA